jgi:serine/threonine protein kinase
MTPRHSSGPLTRDAAETLAAALVGEMIQRWRQGERPLAEDLLALRPELWEHPEAAADLIYEELCLRQEYGLEASTEEVLGRFPQWRAQLEVLLDCQRLLGPRRAAPQFPEVGERLGDFLLLAELGSGAHGCVFLARQRPLGDRPVVVKLTPGEAHEHLSLARLQHTNIVPLYSVQDHPSRGVRVLCMPYFGGGTLGQLLDALRPILPAQRTGQNLVDALDRVQAAVPVVVSPRGPGRRVLSGNGYVQAICWIGACLADGLHYAHERGLVHLDLKPSNVLLTADGQAMLLDFHLAREPVLPDGEPPRSLGGTPGYMSPEQQAALLSLQQGRPALRPVDGRSDVFSLGVVLYEALGGSLPAPGTSPRPLHSLNGRVSVGLGDVVARCLAEDPAARYADMAALAADLRRHLADLPLVGVRNRSVAERWRKWRRRRPHGLALAWMLFAVLLAAGAVVLAGVSLFLQCAEQARASLRDAEGQLARGEWEGAIRNVQRGLSTARGLPFQGDLTVELDRHLWEAEQARTAAEHAAAARELRRLTDRFRFLYGADPPPSGSLTELEPSCRSLWDHRTLVVERLSPPEGSPLDPSVREDLLDLAILWADLQGRRRPPDGTDSERRALTVLDEAETLLGPSAALDAERERYGGPGRKPSAAAHTGWEHYALGRAFLCTGDLDGAAEEARRAVRLQPSGLWPNFLLGLCTYRQGRFIDAATAFGVCIGAAPEAAECYYNRAVALEALGRTQQAKDDFDQAVRLDPSLASAVHNRGRLSSRAGQSAPASRPGPR